MARFWGICSLMLLPAFLLLESQAASIPVEDESSSSAIDFDTGYLIIAPKVFVAESVETICISLQNMTGPLEVAIRLMDNFTAMAKLPIQFMEFKMACYNLEVPSIEYEMMHATLVVKLRRTLVTQSGFEVIERRTVTINGVNTEMFIETDKPVYKPGQTVKFRILNINQDLKPDITPVSKIWIESPSGVRMQQWRKQESTDGLIDLEMPMTTDPVPGTWSIVAIHKGRKTTRTFEVDEYVLPKFEVIITPPTYVMINATSTRVKVCGRYTYGQPVRGSFEARITVKSTGWNFRERRTITRREDDTGPSGCSEFPIDLGRLELNSTDFSLWNARLSVDVDYTETSTGVILQANSESAQITRDALKLQFDSPNIFKPGVPYYGKIFVTHPDGSPAAGKLISLSCNTDQGQIFDKNLTSPENGAIEFTVTDINITSTSLNLYAHAPGFNIPSPETYGRQHVYTLHDPATSHYARPQFSPSGSFLQIAPIRGVAAVGSEQTLRIDFTANDPEENPRFKFVVMSRGNIIATRFYRAHKRPKRQAEGGSTSSSGPSRSVPDGSVDGSEDGSIDGIPSVMPSVGEMPSDMGSLDIPSFIPSVLGGSSFSSDFSFVPPTDAPVIIVQPGEVYSRELFFRVTTDMVPETRILAYYIRTDGEVVADSVAFRVQKKFENEVDIAFSDEEMMPGAETQIMIHAKPGSLCAVGVVDRSVHILGGDNQLKADKIFASLNKYQLTSSGGYIDASTHCVPEEDEYPQFFPLGRKKRGIFLPGYGSKYQDSSRAFKDMGLLFITNMDVETSPCVGVGSVARGSAEVDNAAEGPIAVPLLNKDNAVFDDGDTLETPELPNDVLETAPRIRSYFPETWLWDLRRTDTVTGETSISMEVPDTVTEWIGSGFCTSVEYGVGVSPPTKLRAFQPFFLSYTLPYSVVRGEVVPVTVTVFNYLTESLVVEVSLELNEGFRMARKSRPRKKVCVGGSQSQSVEFRIQPRKLGNIALQALGLSINDQDALCGNELVSSSVGARDSIYKELLVEAEGTEVDTTQNCYFCPEEVSEGEYEKVFNVTLPESIVEGSARGKVSITGDLMGPSLSNLDHLIRLPTGCGEQNMLGFVPNIVALSYLTTTDQLTPSVENKAKFNMKRGYQRELNYRHRDGSYSAFGESDPEGSTWLTAFVVRSFAQASDYIFIDNDDLKVSISWLKSLQNRETGCFESLGKLCHKDMKGGVNTERTLTSYVLITLLEAGLNIQSQVISAALKCVTKDLAEVEDTYTLAQLAYALTLAENPLAQDVMDKLETKAVYEDGLKYWQTNRAKPNRTLDPYAYQAPSTDIEMTSYILLALIGRTVDITQALREGNPIARWIILQRNSNGGFSSTQDTVVALQALSEFAKVAYSEGTSIKAFVEIMPLDGESGEVFPFTITTFNRLVLEEEVLSVLPAQLTLFASGAGCALMQISTTHNEIPESPEDAGFELDVLLLESYESTKNKRCTDYYMKVCARYTGSDEESNMAIIEVKMISGFYPDKDSLRLLQKQHNPLQRYDIDNKNIYFYFNELTNEDTCLVFSIIKEIDVEDAKPGVVQVFDYYDKEINVKQLYDITCEEAPPSWDPSLLYTIPVKPSDGESDGNDGDMRPLPFVLAALRRMDGLVFVEEPEVVSEGIGGGAGGSDVSDVDPGVDNEPDNAIDPMDVARELGPPDVFILCPSGQKFVDGLMRCIPINGCESSPCLEGQNCIDTDAGYLCVGCKPGYRKGSANQCVRIPDPSLNQILCGPGQEYVNGGCITIDQCVDNPCPIDARCRSTAFGHTCETIICPPGRRLTDDLQCVDIDECRQDPCDVGEVCINRILGYDCICAEGYERNSNNTCVDINECEREIEPCGGPEYICMNDKGSYQCFCVEGYVMDQEGYCVEGVEQTPNTTRAPQGIGLETAGATSNVTEAHKNVTEPPSSVKDASSNATETAKNVTEVSGNRTKESSNDTEVPRNRTETPSSVKDASSNATETAKNVTEASNSGAESPSNDTHSNRTEVLNTVQEAPSNGTDAPSSETGLVNKTVAPSNGTEALSNATDSASSASEIHSNVTSSSNPGGVNEPIRTNDTLHQGGEGGGFDGDDRPIIDYGGIKPGTCPVNEEEFGICGGSPCRGDEDCEGPKKCCQKSCGKQCVLVPIDFKEPVDPVSRGDAIEHPGICPMVFEGSSLCNGATCLNDGDCRGDQKCCFDMMCGGTESRCMSAPQIQPPVFVPEPPVVETAEDTGLIPPEIHLGVCPGDVGATPKCDGALCIHDGECGPGEKCCSSAACAEGLRCMPAPQIRPGPLAPKACTGDLVYNECGSACEMTCENPEPQMCIKMCTPGCFCPSVTIRLSPDSDTCLPLLMDVAFQESCPEPPVVETAEDTGLIPPEIHPGVCPGDVGATPKCDGALCIHDGECGPGEKCCSSAACAEGLRCMPAPQIQPIVVVPPVKPRYGSCPTSGVNCDGQECLSDGDCFDNEKCCEADCGSRCTIPVIAPPPPPEVHLGQCPSVEAEGACDNPLCLHDGNCATSEKCCVSACGYHCTPAIPLAPKLGPPPCPGDLVFNRCAVTCELTCDNPNPRPCTRECGIGCYCPEGTIRESENSHFCFPDVSFCLPPNPGPGPLAPKACTGDLVYNECGSACEMTCENPEPQMCIKMCTPGCFCPSVTIRLSPDSDTCLPLLMDVAFQESCPETGPEAPPLINGCTGDLVYTECGSGCERTCDDPDPEMCTEECRAGCFCPGSTVRRSTDSDTCFPILMDVALDVSCQDTKPEPELVLNECPGDLVYTECGSGCERTCDDPDPEMCTEECRAGCFCPGFTVRRSTDSDTCFPILMDVALDVSCKDTKPEPVLFNECPGDLVYTECGSGCERTCDDPDPEMCTEECRAGCFCPDFTVRRSTDSDTCFPILMDVGLDVSCQDTEPEPELVLNECPGDLVYTECGSGCERTCDDPDPEMCTEECRAGCFCPGFTVRRSTDSDTCFPILMDVALDVSCQDTEPEPELVLFNECPGDLVYTECGSGCERTCDDPDPEMCTEECRAGCFCPGFTVRRSTDSDTCFPILMDVGLDVSCQDEPRPCEAERRKKMEESENREGIFIPQCTQDGYYAVEQCYEGNGTFCWCADTETGAVKPDTEVHGARADCERFLPDPSLINQCPEGKVFADGVKKCVPPTCEGDLVYNMCGSACPDICNEEPAQFCTFQCVLDCACPDGLYRVAGTSRCFAQESCPKPCDEGYKHNENLECVVANPCHEMLAAANEMTSRNMVGVYTPSCTTEGKYEPVQCHGSIGFCWCADIETGLEREGTRMRGTPECPAQCENGMVYSECSSTCPDYCGKPESIFCISMCTPGCVCPEGTILFDQDSQLCVAIEDCPVPVIPEVVNAPPAPECTGDLVYKECASACPEFCGQSPERAMCIMMCEPGCGCPDNMILQSEGGDVCVAAEDCPAQCDNGMVYNECGSPCPDYCGKPENEVCITMCSPGCFCPEGTLLVDQETQMCVAREDCVLPVIPAAIESPCPTVLDAAPNGFEENICNFKQIFIVKVRPDGRAKVLDDLTVTPNRFAVKRPIKTFTAEDECDVQMTDRFMIFMDNEVDAMDRADIMLDENDVLVPMTGHFKNRVKEAFTNCPSA
ncbi:uncharacterized protein LOC446192 isoform X6 [Lytechinus variegatus]|uniref:uncharacterized protein LOC446192 isoform X6 n=1 Tax=Lytechinus variegatus TaxID=7654 RepID=UPI001BB2AC43|nr:uncharacterized protein LOC446192 isoform X6 [Lytechinus variegatus]